MHPIPNPVAILEFLCFNPAFTSANIDIFQRVKKIFNVKLDEKMTYIDNNLFIFYRRSRYCLTLERRNRAGNDQNVINLESKNFASKFLIPGRSERKMEVGGEDSLQNANNEPAI